MLKKAISVFTIACMMTSVLTFNVFAQSNAQNLSSNRFDSDFNINLKSERKTGQIIIKFKNNESFEANKSFITRIIQGRIIESQDNGLVLVEVGEDKLIEKIRLLRQIRDVEYVVPNYIRKAV